MIEDDIDTLRQIFEHNKAILDTFETAENSDIECTIGFMAEDKPDLPRNSPKESVIPAFEFIK